MGQGKRVYVCVPRSVGVCEYGGGKRRKSKVSRLKQFMSKHLNKGGG